MMPDHYLECRGEVVTDSAVGEAAYRMLHGVESGLISVTPSNWNFSPIEVTWRREDEGLDDQSTALKNWRDAVALKNGLRAAPQPLRSWDDLRNVSKRRFRNLAFSGDCFDPLAGVPFEQSVTARFVVLLDILDRLARAFDENGARTSEGHWIYQNYFTGGNALFSDSSRTQKRITFSGS